MAREERQQLPWGWRDIKGGDEEVSGQSGATDFELGELTEAGIEKLMRLSLGSGDSDSSSQNNIIQLRLRNLPDNNHPDPQSA